MAKKSNRTERIVFRATPEDRDRFESAAKGDNRVLSDWIRERLDRVATRTPRHVSLALSDSQAKNILTLISANQDDGWHAGDKKRWRESLKDIQEQIVQQIG